METIKANEIRESVWSAVKDYVTKRLAAGKPARPSEGLVHAGLMVYVLKEVESAFSAEELGDEDFISEARFVALVEVENGSSLTQKLVRKEILPKEGTKGGSVASEYL